MYFHIANIFSRNWTMLFDFFFEILVWLKFDYYERDANQQSTLYHINIGWFFAVISHDVLIKES